jgi:uncharacterized cupin superfamily protein
MTQVLTVVRNAAESALGETSPAKLPIGDIVAVAATGQAQTDEAVGASIGVWDIREPLRKTYVLF